MILLIIILTIIFLISLIFFVLCLSSLEIEIKDFNFDSNNIEKRIQNYLIFARIKFLKRLTLLKLSINDKRINKIKGSKFISKGILKKVLLEDEDKILKSENIERLQNLNIKINKLNLEMKIDLLDTIYTSFAVVIMSTILSIILAQKTEKYSDGKYKYIITPIYKNNIQIIIKLNCIINIEMVHIISILYMLFKKRSVDYDERTSDRRTYVCRNE